MSNTFDGLRAIKVSEHVWWVGAVDWTLRDLHGYETPRGTSYNAFLIVADKITLVDTVKAPFFHEMMGRIASVIDPQRIEVVISNHSEMDHTGALPQLLKTINPKVVYASDRGAKALNEHFHFNREITVVKDGETVSLGNLNVQFFETRMLHWPDSMFTWLADDGVLFAQDGFGMHLAFTHLFDDENDWHVLEAEAAKYFANIFGPLVSPLGKCLDRFINMNLPLKIVAPDHGPLWRSHIGKIIGLYAHWMKRTPTNKIVIAYDTMWQSTGLMARAMGESIVEAGGRVKIMPLGSANHRSNVLTELLDAGGFAIGSPTINNNIFPTVADLMCYLKGLRPINLVTAAFGSYGWSGEAVGILEALLRDMKLEPVGSVKAVYVPDHDSMLRCRNLGAQMYSTLKEKVGKTG